MAWVTADAKSDAGSYTSDEAVLPVVGVTLQGTKMAARKAPVASFEAAT